MSLLIRTMLMIVATVICLPGAALSQTISVQDMLQKTDQWAAWAKDGTVVSINGRYAGRVDRMFRLENLSIQMTPTRYTTMPQGLQAGVRMTVSGVLKRSGSAWTMDVSRIAVGNTDSERLISRIERLDPKQMSDWYEVADEFGKLAEFYQDESLRRQVLHLRMDAFKRQRELARGDSVKLARLAEFGATIDVDPMALEAIRFESLVAAVTVPDADDAQVLKNLKTHLPAWDRRDRLEDSGTEQGFLKDPVGEYEAADETVRTQMQRRYYRKLRLPMILKTLKTDGSNGLEIAAMLEQELPEDQAEAEMARRRYVDFRISKVSQLTRRQLDELDELLTSTGRSEELPQAVEQWLAAQKKRLMNGQLDGLLATAEEYLFAFERWKHEPHRTTAVDLLKQGWSLSEKTAPKEAAAIAQRLEQFGWTRLKNQWLTNAEVAALPSGNVDLAMREGRVVKGMTGLQVVTILGKPDRRVRVVSSGGIQEIWIYGDDGSSSEIHIHVLQGRSGKPEDAVATLVSRRAQLR
ncbi:MAG: hypothetical protein R3C49_08765 [Planctomycetaceae bacterium]